MLHAALDHRRGGTAGFVVVLGAVLLAGVAGVAPAHAAGGPFVVEDVEVDDPGSCKVESFASFASNRDFVGVVQPACAVNLGRPVEIAGEFSRFRSAGEWGTSFTFKGKTNLIPVSPGRVGLGLVAGASANFTTREIDGVFVTVPLTYQATEQLRFNLNGGWLWDPSTGLHAATWGVGAVWNFVKPLSLIGEVFGIAGAGHNRDPRAQVGLRYTPQEQFDIDIVYGRNITGENAHWVTIGLTVRFNPAGAK
jgi:hypothetical protein